MVKMIACMVLVVGIAQAAPARIQQPGGTHDKPFWRGLIKNEYKPPAGESAAPLAFELSKMLGSSDPEVRDDIAYNILSTWIYKTHQLDTATVRALTAERLGNLAAVSNGESKAVLRRSFSALMLSVVVAHDNAEPYLEKQEFRKIWDGALAYLSAETDLRGYENGVGWMHSAAHTADLLKFLARSRYVESADQAALLAAVRRKLSLAPIVFIYGEDERYARTVLSIIMRKDFDVEAFKKWAAELRPTFPEGADLNEQKLHGVQNVKNFLAKLDFVIRAQPDAAPGVTAAEEAVRASAKGTF